MLTLSYRISPRRGECICPYSMDFRSDTENLPVNLPVHSRYFKVKLPA
jgi:hypothetical protein